MMFSRILLGFTGLAFALYGLYCSYDLDIVIQTTGVLFRIPAAAVEARAMYGGLQTGLGLLFLLTAVNTRATAFGLLAMVLVLGCLALGRGVGIWANGSDPYNQGAILYESLSAVLALVALWRERRLGDSKLFG